MKIKFDIKYRDKIESGKYQVVLDDNTPVTVDYFYYSGNYYAKLKNKKD